MILLWSQWRHLCIRLENTILLYFYIIINILFSIFITYIGLYVENKLYCINIQLLMSLCPLYNIVVFFFLFSDLE